MSYSDLTPAQRKWCDKRSNWIESTNEKKVLRYILKGCYNPPRKTVTPVVNKTAPITKAEQTTKITAIADSAPPVLAAGIKILPTSGPISYGLIRETFSRSGTVDISNYLRGGSIVPAAETTTSYSTYVGKSSTVQIARQDHTRFETKAEETVSNIYNYYPDQPASITVNITAGQAWVKINGTRAFSSGNNRTITKPVTITISPSNNGSFTWQTGQDGGGGSAYIEIPSRNTTETQTSTTSNQINRLVPSTANEVALSKYYGARPANNKTAEERYVKPPTSPVISVIPEKYKASSSSLRLGEETGSRSANFSGDITSFTSKQIKAFAATGYATHTNCRNGSASGGVSGTCIRADGKTVPFAGEGILIFEENGKLYAVSTLVGWYSSVKAKDLPSLSKYKRAFEITSYSGKVSIRTSKNGACYGSLGALLSLSYIYNIPV